MFRVVALCSLLLGIGVSAHAESDPYWDGSTVRNEHVSGAVRGGTPKRSRLRIRYTHFKKPAASRSAIKTIPNPKRKTPLTSGKKGMDPATRRQLRNGLAAAGAASLGIGLMLLLTRKPRLRGKTRWMSMADLPSEELKRKKPPTMSGPRDTVPPAPLPKPGPFPNEYVSPQPDALAYNGRWWAITMHEQFAIDLWNESVEKDLGIESLDRWLDANADELPRVDVELLKKKLNRNV